MLAGRALLPVGSDDVGLDSIVGRIRRVVGGHDPFEEVPLSGIAVVASGTQESPSAS